MVIVMLFLVMVSIVVDISGMFRGIELVRWVEVLILVGRIVDLVGISRMLSKVRVLGMLFCVIRYDLWFLYFNDSLVGFLDSV